MAPGLSYTALNQNNIQRQNVRLALKIFEEKNVVTLDHFGIACHCDVSSTSNFMLAVAQLWKIFNIKHPLKGQRLNDPFCEPLTSMDSCNVQWLQSFHSWLILWEGLNIPQRQSILTKETMFVLKHTVNTACHLTEYLLTKLRIK